MKDQPSHHLVQDDYREMQEVIEKEGKAGTGTWLECFTGQPSGIPKLVYRTLLGISIHFLQQWTGVSLPNFLAAWHVTYRFPHFLIGQLFVRPTR